ncbi:MAG: hypothetical protein ABIR96_07480 [Bdellovibrionota bacterium]
MSSSLTLVLSSVSSTVRWVAFDAKDAKIVAERAWNDDQTRALSDSLAREVQALGIDLSKIERVAVLTGPGAFTGLRMGVAFAMGLARGLKIPLIGVPTWNLFSHDIFIPTRQQMAKKLSLQACLEASLEFMHLTSEREVIVESALPTSFVVGTAERPDWPQPHELVAAVIKTLAQSSRVAPTPIEIFYGMEPKISGQREADKRNEQA